MTKSQTVTTGREPLGLAILGLGTAGAVMLAAALSRSDVRVIAVADPRIAELPLSALPATVRRYADLQDLLEDDEIAAVHVATPTPLHLEHAAAILRHGKSVIVEKPMAIDRREASELVEIASAAQGVLIVGHSFSFEPEVQAAAALARDPSFGEIRSVISTKTTEWLRRPRLREELDPAKGGGILRRQAVHQVDVVRTLLGSDSLAVVEASVRLDRGRSDVASYMAWLRTPRGQTVSLYYDGVGGRLLADSLTEQSADDDERRAAEQIEKRRRSDQVLGQLLSGELGRVVDHDRGETVVMGSNAELRISANSLVRSDDSGLVSIDLSQLPSGHDAVLDELLGALEGRTANHDAAWGCENIRICEEIESRALAG